MIADFLSFIDYKSEKPLVPDFFTKGFIFSHSYFKSTYSYDANRGRQNFVNPKRSPLVIDMVTIVTKFEQVVNNKGSDYGNASMTNVHL